MRNYYSDPTGNAAVGSADREFKNMIDVALRFRKLKGTGAFTPEREREIRRMFSGVFSVLLEDDFLDKIEEERKIKAKK